MLKTGRLVSSLAIFMLSISVVRAETLNTCGGGYVTMIQTQRINATNKFYLKLDNSITPPVRANGGQMALAVSPNVEVSESLIEVQYNDSKNYFDMLFATALSAYFSGMSLTIFTPGTDCAGDSKQFLFTGCSSSGDDACNWWVD